MRNRIIRYHGVNYDSYRQLQSLPNIPIRDTRKKKNRWNSKTYFAVEVVGRRIDSAGIPLVTVHYTGWSQVWDCEIPESELKINIPRPTETFLSYFATEVVRNLKAGNDKIPAIHARIKCSEKGKE